MLSPCAGDVVIGADPERGHTAAAVYVDNAPLATTAALCRALPKALPGKLPSSIFGKVGARWERAATGHHHAVPAAAASPAASREVDWDLPPEAPHSWCAC